MPFLGSVEGRFGYLGVPTVIAQTGDPYTQINTIATYLRNYMADFRNPSFYVYNLDGSGFYINDGGGDMYNGGCGAFFYTTGANVKNILAIQTLLSKNSGVLVTAAECQTVVTNFTLRIKQALSY